MIALIALAALAVVVGVVVGIIALILAIVKAMVRRPGPPATTSSNEAALTCTQEDEREFERIVSREWPNS